MPSVPKGWGFLSRLAKIVIVAVVFLLVADSFVRVRAGVLPPPLKWATPDLDRKAEQMDDLATNDGASVVFLGSSTVDGSVDPSEMTLPGDRPAYNAAVRGGTIAMVNAWGRLRAIPTLDPDVVVVGVASRELSRLNPLQQARVDNFFDAPAARHLTGNESALLKAERMLEGVSAIFKYRTLIREKRYLWPVLGFGEAPSHTQTLFGDYIGPDGQFLPFLRRAYNEKVFLAEYPEPTEIDPTQIDELRELLAYAKGHAKHVVVVNMPVTTHYPTSPADHVTFSKLLAAETKRAGVRYVNVGIWPQELFADPVHVNAKGSAKLTKLLQDAVAKDVA